MANDEESQAKLKAKFAVILGASPGSGEHGRATAGSSRHLVEVARVPAPAPGQLCLPGIFSPSTSEILLLSFARLAQRGLQAIVQSCHPEYIIDIRVAPTFSPIAPSKSTFTELLANHGIEFLHSPEISNRFSGDAWHPELLRDRFTRHLRANAHILEKISSWALSSAVLVISADPQTRGSDREIFANEIRRISASVSCREVD